MRDVREFLQPSLFPRLQRDPLRHLQVNLGYRCNQSCVHCHVNAGPNRTEMMQDKTVDQLISVLAKYPFETLDLTGGAPELHPRFKDIVIAARKFGVHVIDRCNLTVLFEPGQEGLADFLTHHQVEITASLPCYTQATVDTQRGKGVFDDSIAALQLLNKKGYGSSESLVLNLVYNPAGPSLPPEQTCLEQDYKKELNAAYGIQFNHLYTITNMPIQRFGSMLVSKGLFDEYMALLMRSHNECNLQQVMCKNTISFDWQGYAYDCDFNQMLSLPLITGSCNRLHIQDFDPGRLDNNPITTANHCYGCTAGSGSSCTGSLNF